MARFEVLGLNADRDPIWSFAKRLATDDPDSAQIRAAVRRNISGESSKKGGILGALRRSPSGRRRFGSLTAGKGCALGGSMRRYLLNTNIISNVTKPLPSEALLTWMAEQADENLFICSLTVAEIRRGLLEKPAGKKRKELERWFSGPEGPQSLFAGRVLPFGEKAGLVWARLMADGTAAGRPRNPLDMIIAAVAEVNDCVVVADNEKDFAGLKIANPLRVAN